MSEVKELNTKGGENRFKFTSFSEKLRSIDVDVIHSVHASALNQSLDADSYFLSGLMKWRSLHHTQEFNEFSNEVFQYCKTFNMVLYHKDKIIKMLMGRILVPNTPAYEPFIGLAISLAKDLRSEIYEYFPDIINSIIYLVKNSKENAHLIEVSFNGIGFLIKYLKKELISNIMETFKVIEPLLKDSNKFIRWFTAPSLAYLLRKLSDDNLKEFIILAISKMCNDSREEYKESLAVIIFESVKGPKKSFHSRTPRLMKKLFETLLSAGNRFAFDVFETSIRLMLIHCSEESGGQIIRKLVESAMKYAKTPDESENVLLGATKILKTSILIRNGSKCTSSLDDITSFLSMVLNSHAISSKENLQVEISSLSAALISKLNVQQTLNIKKDISIIFRWPLKLSFYFSILQSNYALEKFNSLLLKELIIRIDGENEACINSFLRFMLSISNNAMEDLLKSKIFLGKNVNNFILESFSESSLQSLTISDDYSQDFSAVNVQSDFQNLCKISVALESLKIMEISDAIVAKLEVFIERLYISCEDVTKVSMKKSPTIFLLTHAMRIYIEYINHKIPKKLVDMGFNLLSRYSNNHQVIKTAAALLQKIKQEDECTDLFSFQNFQDIFSSLVENLASPILQLRINTLKIFQLYSQLPWNNSGSSSSWNECNIFTMMLEVETVENLPNMIRKKLLNLRKIHTCCVVYRQLPEFYFRAIPNFCCAQLMINFRPIWKDSMQLMADFWKTYPNNASTWETWWKFVSLFEVQDDWKNYFENYFLEKDVSDWLEINHSKVKLEWKNQVSDSEFSDSSITLSRHLESFARGFLENGQIGNSIIYLASSCDFETLRSFRLDHQNFFKLMMKVSYEFYPQILEKYADEFLFDCLHNAYLNSLSFKNWPLSRIIMIECMKLFAKFRNPEKTISHHRNEKLLSMYYHFTVHGDSLLQDLAVNCLFTYQSLGIRPYEEQFKALLSPKTFKDTLSSMKVGEGTMIVREEHRSKIIPLVTRILYGKMSPDRKEDIKKVSARRIIILSYISGYHESEMDFFVDLLLEPFKNYREAIERSIKENSGDLHLGLDAIITEKPKFVVGFLHRLGDSLKYLRAKMVKYIEVYLTILLNIAVFSVNRENNPEINEHDALQKKYMREIRTLCMQRINEVFKLTREFDLGKFSRYVSWMFKGFLSSRLETFEHENVQNPTEIFKLFICWSEWETGIEYLTQYDSNVLPKIYSCLSSSNVKPIVISCVLDLVENILSTNEQQRKVLAPSAGILIDNLETLIKNSESVVDEGKISKDLMVRKQIWILSEMSDMADNLEQLERLTQLLVPFLHKPEILVPESTKCDILSLLKASLPRLPSLKIEDARIEDSLYFNSLSRLFESLSNRISRQILTEVFSVFVQYDPKFLRIFNLIESLNSYSIDKIEEPDWKRRFDAFNNINEEIYAELSHFEWKPLLHNLLFFINDKDEQVIRSSATNSLKTFVNHVSLSQDTENVLMGLLIHVVYSAVKKGIKSHHEVVRAEFVEVLASLVKNFRNHELFSDMVCLLSSGDEEANFFNNIYHIQHHRRSRALRKLNSHIINGEIKSSLLNNIFLPMASNFVFELDRSLDHNLLTESINTIGCISGRLSWNQYNNLLKQYFRAIPRKLDLTKTLIRVITTILDNFHWDLTETELDRMNESISEKAEFSNLAPDSTLENRIHLSIVNKILPELFGYLSDRKEGDSNLGVRVTVALAYAKLLKKLPDKSLNQELPRFLTNVCQVLKSRNQETRDIARDVLVQVALILGKPHFITIVRELKLTLTKGYQLRVLSFSIYHLLLSCVPKFSPGDIDSSLIHIVQILLNDVFLWPKSSELEMEELSGSKELKSKKSIQSFELVAKIVSFSKIVEILRLIRDILQESPGSEITNRVEEILAKFCLGLTQNHEIDLGDISHLNFELMSSQGVLFEIETLKQPKNQITSDNLEENFTVQSFARTEDQLKIENHLAENKHLLVEFGFKSFLAIIKKGFYNSENVQHLEILNSTLILLVDSLSSKNSKIINLSLQILCQLVKYPLEKKQNFYSKVVEIVLKILRRAPSTNGEISQNALKLMSAVIRDTKTLVVNDNQLVFLITLIRPDLECVEKQSVTFSLVKSIVMKKLMVPEMYELMDDIARVMITNQTERIRTLCRGALLQFMSAYPIGQRRLKKHMNFIVSNFEYAHESGRLSVFEYINQALEKFLEKDGKEFLQLVFMALNLRLLKDPSPKCKESAHLLIKKIFMLSSKDNVNAMIGIVEEWIESYTSNEMLHLAVHAIGIMFEASGESDSTLYSGLNLEKLLVKMNDVLENCDSMPGTDWTIKYSILVTSKKSYAVFPARTFNCINWKVLREIYMIYEHPWIRSATCKVFTELLCSIDSKSLTVKNSNLTVTAEEISEICQSHCEQLKFPNLAEEHGTEIVKNLCRASLIFKTRSELNGLGDQNDKADRNYTLKIVKTLSVHLRKLLNKSNYLISSLIFKYFEFVVQKLLNAESLKEYLIPIMAPVYRYTVVEIPKDSSMKKTQSNTHWEGTGLAKSSVTLVQQAQSLMVLLESAVMKLKHSKSLYFEALSAVTQKMAENRAERRKKEKQLALIDPEANAMRKMRKNQKKVQSRKRRIGDIMKSKNKLSIKRVRLNN